MSQGRDGEEEGRWCWLRHLNSPPFLADSPTFRVAVASEVVCSISNKAASGTLTNAYPAGATSSSTFQMQRIGAELRFSVTLGEEPEVELALV